MGLFRSLRRWWALRNPEIRWIVEVGVDEVPDEEHPIPEPLPTPYEYVSRSVEESSILLRDPAFTLDILRASEEYRKIRVRLERGFVKRLVSLPRYATGYWLLMLEGDIDAWLLLNNAFIVAARADIRGDILYGLGALRVIDEAEGEADLVEVKLRDSLYTWGPEFSVYVKGIDNQHYFLVTTLNNLYRHLLAGSEREVVDRILDALASYTKFHFRSEEVLFDKYGYPRAEGHRRQHQSFVNKVTEFMERYQANEERLTLRVLHFLAEWVRNHILVSDHDYGEWFLKQGVPIIDEKRAEESRRARRKLGLDRELGHAS